MSKRRSKSNNQKKHNLLPYKTIRAASTGDPDAVNTVLLWGDRIWKKKLL